MLISKKIQLVIKYLQITLLVNSTRHLFKALFIYFCLEGRFTQRDRQIFYMLIHSQMVKQPELSPSEARSSELLLGLPHGCRDPSTRLIMVAFPSALTGSQVRNRAIRSLIRTPLWDATQTPPLTFSDLVCISQKKKKKRRGQKMFEVTSTKTFPNLIDCKYTYLRSIKNSK